MDIEGSLASARTVGNDIYLVSNSGMRNPVDLWDLVWGETAEDLPPVPDWDASEEEFLAAQDPAWVSLKRSRERDECRSKLERLGLMES